jgi:NTE family protein
LEVVVKVQERSTALLRLSAGVTSERYTRLGIELTQENLFGFGTRISARFAGGLRDRFAALELGSNRIYGTYWTFRTRGYGLLRNVNVFERHINPEEEAIERSALGEYREFRVGGLARFGRQVERFGVVSIEGRFERQGTRNLTIPATDEKWRTITSLKFGTRFDTDDRFPYPRSGTLIDLSYETAQHLLGADESFSKFSVEAGYTATLGKGHVIHPHLRMGFSDITLPLLEQFSLGGQYSMYGLREDESRGRQLLLASLEYRYMLPFKLYFDTYVGLRYDLGATWPTPTEIRLNDLEHGIGLSIGLDTPLGPADFAVGRSFIFNKNGVPTLIYFGPVVAYFSFGFPFN